MCASQLLAVGVRVAEEWYPPKNTSGPALTLLRPMNPAIGLAVPEAVATTAVSQEERPISDANRTRTALPRAAVRAQRTRTALAVERAFPPRTVKVLLDQVPKSRSVLGSTTTADPSAVFAWAMATTASWTDCTPVPSAAAPARAAASAAPYSWVLTTRTCDTSTANDTIPLAAVIATSA